jgi:ATP-dependent DNA ligase
VFFKFIQPCSPVLAKSVPAGDDWQHEIKFDGFRVQAHIIGKTVALYSRSGRRFSPRFARLVRVLGEFPARLVGSAGKSAGRAPLSMLSMKDAASCHSLTMLGP